MPSYHHGNLRPALLAAAERSLRQHGADQLSLRELAREAGVSHAAPRRHFPDRQALLDALAETGFARLEAELRVALDAAGAGFRPRLHAMAATYLRFATEDAALLELMFTSKKRAGADRLVAAAAAPFGLMQDLIAQGQDQGILQAGDPERVGVVLFATLQGIATLTNGKLVPPELLEGIGQTAVDQFIRAAGPATSAPGPAGKARQ
ncbi:TetR/AcrR family transcriptional regulator [Solwaraspora sp. WMMD1047]|uniref:TetR/AcrR family transcriptional regulator n=1 Tax=Solwaraspora sp. WMMD1047 TaxID=3016102 RepID=UPI00241710F9|nr:TetR/AcrR family transcriptional regulator [Solwaraspora sp. WMMD1047]MDG4830408.1 TetR/AcrR family transcriptional regulator [Solwaraspora sp. WMMD1047]